jgi:hypothetical protein
MNDIRSTRAAGAAMTKPESSGKKPSTYVRIMMRMYALSRLFVSIKTCLASTGHSLMVQPCLTHHLPTVLPGNFQGITDISEKYKALVKLREEDEKRWQVYGGDDKGKGKLWEAEANPQEKGKPDEFTAVQERRMRAAEEMKQKANSYSNGAAVCRLCHQGCDVFRLPQRPTQHFPSAIT